MIRFCEKWLTIKYKFDENKYLPRTKMKDDINRKS